MNLLDLSLKNVVLFIACGVLGFIIVFIFAKRQITRYSLRSGRGPHATIGEQAPKVVKREIVSLLQRVTDVRYEPTLLRPEADGSGNDTDDSLPHHHYRMKAVDGLKLLDAAIAEYDGAPRRQVAHSLLGYLQKLRHNGPLLGAHSHLVASFANAYNHARHGPDEFSQQQYSDYEDSLKLLIQIVGRNCRRSRVAPHLPRAFTDVTCDAPGSVTLEMTQRRPTGSRAGSDASDTHRLI